MSWARACDLVYGFVGLLIVAGVWSFQGVAWAVWTGLLMLMCYLAGDVKFRHP